MAKRVSFVFALVALVAAAVPALADPQGYEEADLGIGYFYGTFGESPNLLLLAGGSAGEFCADNPGDPFNASPGTAPSRLFARDDGSVDEKVNGQTQPIYLYESGALDAAPVWISGVCAGDIEPVLLAEGAAVLKVRNSYLFEDGPPVRIFNSVNGTATGSDGRTYKVRASADIPFVDGAPVGSPPEWVSLEVTEIGR